MVTAKQWADALRSGEYRQIQNVYHDPQSNGYCCLGVLAELQGRDLHDGPQGDGTPIFGGLSYTTYLGVNRAALIRMNDGMDDKGIRPFSEIADYIEAHAK